MKNTKPYQPSHSYVVILAGGEDNNFWPISRSNYPKQFLDILNTGETLIQATLRRFQEFIPTENIYVITLEDYIPIVTEQLPKLAQENIISEPERKNTAASITYISSKLNQLDKDANLIVAPADHIIGDEKTFQDNCKNGLHFTAKYDVLLTLGIEATHPDSKYGYIHFGHEIVGDEDVLEVYQFIEKPDVDTSRMFLEAGNILWNSGVFIWKVSALLQAMAEFQPSIFQLFDKVKRSLNTSIERSVIKQVYQKCASISIEYAIMEYARNVYVIPSNFKWNDLGTWTHAYERFQKDSLSNAMNDSNIIAKDSSNCVIQSHDKKLFVIGGVHDLIIVNTPDALMVCHKNKESEVKEYFNAVKQEKGNSYL
ncbi:mannose-1-phosphate guanylyltransferase [Echinicola sp. 20G]|uniref:mannose-1-phosphate guanylyltransferase n=1 Tax=Echinicola sp. 20G TaxID=2781961 RepID=UPI0019111FF4|nr:sugar phosphate nucleotidyltransferase [Echinicola sp. 20G]